jgi:hypothetical protein
MIGRERLPAGAVDDELLLEAEALAEAAMSPAGASERPATPRSTPTKRAPRGRPASSR